MASTSTSETASSFVCEYCKKKFTSKGNLTQHRKIHLPKVGYKCALCSYVTNFKGRLTQHQKLHTNERPYKCPHPNCGMTFRQNPVFRAHLNVHKKGDESLLRYKCSICPYKSSRRGNLKAHVISIHSEAKPFFCDLCPFQAKLKSTVTRHVKRRHPSTTDAVQCPHVNCVYSCKIWQDLAKSRGESLVCPIWESERKRNEEEKLFRCSLCNYSSQRLNDLVTHSQSQSHDYKEEILDSSESGCATARENLDKATSAKDWTHVQCRLTGEKLCVKEWVKWTVKRPSLMQG